MKIYVASSWRNERQPIIVQTLRLEGHKVYDFKNPEENGDSGFHWSDIDSNWQQWSQTQFRESLTHPIAKHGFKRDFDAMTWADAFVLLMPCGRSAHLEAGWAVGAKKPLAIYLSDGEPELMYGMASKLVVNLIEMVEWAEEAQAIVEAMSSEQEGKLLAWMIERKTQPGAMPLGAPEKWWLGKLLLGELMPGRGWVNMSIEDLTDDFIKALGRTNLTSRGHAIIMMKLLRTLVPGVILSPRKIGNRGFWRRHYEFPGLEECRSHFETMYGKQDWGVVLDSWTHVGLARIRPKRAT